MPVKLPHDYPFLMVDRVVEVVPGRRAVVVKTVTADNLFTASRAGGISPEVFVLEMMAQAGAFTAASAGSEDRKVDTGGVSRISGYLAGLNDVIFHARPKVGDTIVMTLEFEAGLGALARFRGEARISGELVVEAGLTFTVESRK